MNGIKNFLFWIDQNWMNLVVIIGLLIGLYKKIHDYLSKTDDEKIEIAKHHIQESILKMITDAEQDYENWNKAGSIKRSQVVKEIFDTYPILNKISNQQELIAWIDSQIDDALKTLRQIIKENTPTETTE